MSSSRSPRPEPGPGQPRLRPSDERALLAESTRTARRIAIAAIVVASVALGLAAWRFVVPAGSSCQETAWDTTPATADIPAGWTVSASQYDVGRKQMTVAGPVPTDETSAQAVTYATITCFASGAEDAVTRSADAATAAGQVVTARDDLGDQAFEASDQSGATFVQLRHGDVVVYLAASGATGTEVDQFASAFDKALGGDGGRVAVGTPDVQPSDAASEPVESPSDEAEVSIEPAAPDLEAAIPAQVGDVTLGIDSATGDDVLGDDPGAQAVVAALRAAGHEPGDLKVAYASDDTGATDLTITGLAVDGIRQQALLDLVLTAWLPTGGAGVTTEPATVGGREVSRVDYGGGSKIQYVLSTPDGAFVVSTSDADLAAEALAALP